MGRFHFKGTGGIILFLRKEWGLIKLACDLVLILIKKKKKKYFFFIFVCGNQNHGGFWKQHGSRQLVEISYSVKIK